MPIYNVDGETYNISDKEVKAFENDFPNAKVRYSVDGEDYDIAINEREDFPKTFPMQNTARYRNKRVTA